MKINPLTDTDGAWTANVETDVYRTGAVQNVTLDYSTYNGWDVGLSLLNVQITGPNKIFQGDTFLNLSKSIDITQNLSVSFNSHNGVALAHVHPQEWFNFSFIDSRFNLNPWLRIHGGPYFANSAITGSSSHVGFLTGFEITILENQFSLQMDYISGRHALSGASINMQYNLMPEWQIYLGVLVPEQHSGNEFAGVLGFNFSSHPL